MKKRSDYDIIYMMRKDVPLASILFARKRYSVVWMLLCPVNGDRLYGILPYKIIYLECLLRFNQKTKAQDVLKEIETKISPELKDYINSLVIQRR